MPRDYAANDFDTIHARMDEIFVDERYGKMLAWLDAEFERALEDVLDNTGPILYNDAGWASRTWAYENTSTYLLSGRYTSEHCVGVDVDERAGVIASVDQQLGDGVICTHIDTPVYLISERCTPGHCVGIAACCMGEGCPNTIVPP